MAAAAATAEEGRRRSKRAKKDPKAVVEEGSSDDETGLMDNARKDVNRARSSQVRNNYKTYPNILCDPPPRRHPLAHWCWSRKFDTAKDIVLYEGSHYRYIGRAASVEVKSRSCFLYDDAGKCIFTRDGDPWIWTVIELDREAGQGADQLDKLVRPC